MLALGLGLLALAGCRRAGSHPLITYYNPDHALTLQYPADWKTEQARQPDGTLHASINAAIAPTSIDGQRLRARGSSISSASAVSPCTSSRMILSVISAR